MKRVRVILAEDSQAVARELSIILSREFEVIGMVEDGMALLSAARLLQPDVVVTDIVMPLMDGLDAAGQLKRDRSGLGIVFITVHNDLQLVDRAMTLGNCSYVLKSQAGEDLVLAVHAAAAGKSFVSNSIAYTGMRS